MYGLIYNPIHNRKDKNDIRLLMVMWDYVLGIIIALITEYTTVGLLVMFGGIDYFLV